LIVHDDLPAFFPWRDLAAHWERLLSKIYAAANSRLCISPFMEEEYRRRYGTAGGVLYPLVDPEVNLDRAPDRVIEQKSELIFAYAGSIGSDSVRAVIERAARAIVTAGHRLLIYCTNPDALAGSPLGTTPRVMIKPPLRPRQLRLELAERADILLLPGPFAESQRANGSLLFPTKLTEYAATGLPLFICGAGWNSVCLWAAEHGVAAALVTEDCDTAFADAAGQAADPENRRRSAVRFRAFARANFDHAAVSKKFYDTLMLHD